MLIVEFSGYKSVLLYSNEIFLKTTKFITATLFTIFIGIALNVFTLVSFIIVDKIKRKILFFTTVYFMILHHALFITFGYTGLRET